MIVPVAPPALASNALIWATDPVSVTLLVPDPPTVTPLEPGATVSVPSPTDSVATMFVAPPASTSATASPVPCSVRMVCSVAAYVSGVIVAVGASFTAATVSVTVCVALLT